MITCVFGTPLGTCFATKKLLAYLTSSSRKSRKTAQILLLFAWRGVKEFKEILRQKQQFLSCFSRFSRRGCEVRQNLFRGETSTQSSSKHTGDHLLKVWRLWKKSIFNFFLEAPPPFMCVHWFVCRRFSFTFYLVLDIQESKRKYYKSAIILTESRYSQFCFPPWKQLPTAGTEFLDSLANGLKYVTFVNWISLQDKIQNSRFFVENRNLWVWTCQKSFTKLKHFKRYLLEKPETGLLAKKT